MTLAAMLDVHDASALSALASVGVVRRATRDFDAGKFEVTARSDDDATVIADGQTVQIVASGPAAATCSCPATGICRHIILATLALRAAEPQTTEDQSANDEILSLTDADLHKFAGADWDKAINQAQISTQATVTPDGANLSVLLPDLEMPITFLARQGLAGAVYKGAKTTKRRVVTAAALVVRQQAGTATLDQLARNAPETETITAPFLQQVQSAIAAIVTGVMTGGSAIAQDRLFDLSISARAQSAPRLTALLRVLARHARHARAHHLHYHDDRFLADAALTYALAQALAQNPANPTLTGVLRRTYRDSGPCTFIILGATLWHADSGARGLRAYGLSPGTGEWVSTGQARGAGMDPSFSPDGAYTAPIWGAGNLRDLTGWRVAAQSLRIASDQQIAWDGGQARAQDKQTLDQIQAISHHSWDAAHADLAERAPMGLGNSGASLPLLVSPHQISDLSLDELSQRYQISLQDQSGATLPLSIPTDAFAQANWLDKNKHTIRSILCEVTIGDEALSIRPVTAFFVGGADLRVCNLTLDHVILHDKANKLSLGAQARDLFNKAMGTNHQIATKAPDALTVLCSAIMDQTAEALRFHNVDGLPPLARQADSLGLQLLANAIRRFAGQTDAQNAMRLAYLVSQTQRRSRLGGASPTL